MGHRRRSSLVSLRALEREVFEAVDLFLISRALRRSERALLDSPGVNVTSHRLTRICLRDFKR